MIQAINSTSLSVALSKLGEIVKGNEEKGYKTVVFCEDRLSLAAERTICTAVGGTFLTSVYTFARFLSSETGAADDVLSSQGSAMVIRKIIEDNREKLTLFKKLSASFAAEAVYDTLALLYSSRISSEDVKKASGDGLLGGKLHDLGIIYSEYEKFLDESGKKDRNGYLRSLGPIIESSLKIRGQCVIFLGYQAFTSTSLDCVRAAFSSARDIFGIFIGGAEDIYVNEAAAAFVSAAKEYGGARFYAADGERLTEAEILRRSLFDPESFYYPPTPTDRVSVYEAADFEEELEFIAACIKKHVFSDGERYAKISVMLPDLDDSVRALDRVFSRFNIPYYADRRIPLSEHSLCAFIINLLVCVRTGCRPQDVDGIVSSPYFPAERKDKDVFRNYMLRLGNFRGSVKRQPDEETLKDFGFDTDSIEKVRKPFLKALSLMSENSGNCGIFWGVKAVLTEFAVKEKLEKLAEEFKDIKPAAAQFSLRAYDAALKVLDEAESIAGDMPPNELIKVLRSGFSAMKISLIPPKSDAVFVGDLSATANTGSNVVFVSGLTGDVPASSGDTALLTDREIAALQSIDINISPKISQVNARRREICALNVCAFRNRLYLTYSTSGNAAESGVSEIISYARSVFSTPQGDPLLPLNAEKIEKSGKLTPYYCCELLPALKYLQKHPDDKNGLAVYKILVERGYKNFADFARNRKITPRISCGKALYAPYGSISPTSLETYFACPYLNFMRQGLRAREREEGIVRAVDTGNFIHSILQDLAAELNEIDGEERLKERARQLGLEKLSKPPYSSLTSSAGGKYAADELIEEAISVSVGMFEQIKNSSFTVSAAENKCEIKLPDGIKLTGRIDRIDQSGEMIRIIDYKTGTIGAEASKYYAGLKLQLPLYLLAVAKGGRPVGAYYFPASVVYKKKPDGVFRLQGFMDGSDDVIAASDNGILPKEKSRYVNATLGAKGSESAMPREEFGDFLEYSLLIANGGADEMCSGSVAPSPSDGVCEFCPAGGSCGFAAGRDGVRRTVPTIKCSQIAKIVKTAKEKKDGTN